MSCGDKGSRSKGQGCCHLTTSMYIQHEHYSLCAWNYPNAVISRNCYFPRLKEYKIARVYQECNKKRGHVC